VMIKTRTIADSLRGYSLDELRRKARANGGTPNDAQPRPRRRHGPYKRRPYVPPQQESRRATWGDPTRGARRRSEPEAEPKRGHHKSTASRNGHDDVTVHHHRTLGVRPGATREEIRSAYRRLATLHHPDHGGSVERMREINLAYHAVKGDR
jgi:DnaJ-domain-containing protein 1